MNVHVVTANNYFFLGIKEHFRSKGKIVKKISPRELRNNPVRERNKDDFFIFNTSSYLDKLLFFITTDPLPGSVISFPIEHNKTTTNGLKWNGEIDMHYMVDFISYKMAKYSQNDFSLMGTMFVKLTKRERTILFYHINGMDISAISQLFNISVKTVYSHRQSALQKLGGRNFFEIWPKGEWHQERGERT